MNKYRFNMELPQSLYEQVRQLAEENGMTVTKVIRDALGLYLSLRDLVKNGGNLIWHGKDKEWDILLPYSLREHN